MKQKSIPPTQLFVGEKSVLTNQSEKFLKSVFCKSKDSNTCFCVDCRKISNRQHHSIVWISPEKSYTVDDVEVIFDNSRLSLDNNQIFFFVLENVETLNLATANRLLKILEEPATGYHFILTTDNPNVVIPTILSRSTITRFESDKTKDSINPILKFFYDLNKDPDPFQFESELRKQNLSNYQSIEIANQMICHFSKKTIDLNKENFLTKAKSEIKDLEIIVDFLKEKMQKPPQQGSSTLFWKNLFLQFPWKE
jgi:hypothetical protein